LVDSGDLAHDLQRSFSFFGFPYLGATPHYRTRIALLFTRRVAERNSIPFTAIVNVNTSTQNRRLFKKGCSSGQRVLSILANSRKESGFPFDFVIL
jgi:hypothetical protein